jgi:putative Mg2+ transporter-C (MgtC) family protein
MRGLEVIIGWEEIAWRLGGATAAGVLIGLNRGEHGKPAGLRTVLLVCLAAALAMILMNLLISTRGKAADSFVQLDMMRLPLGVLCGIGFIGAGAIIKKDELVVGVTTAATIWYVTMIGFCFGSGQLMLGLVGTAMGLAILTGLSWVENVLKQERRGRLLVTMKGDSGKTMEEDVRKIIGASGCAVVSWGVAYGEGERTLRCEVQWHARRHETRPPKFLQELVDRAGTKRVVWRVM